MVIDFLYVNWVGTYFTFRAARRTLLVDAQQEARLTRKSAESLPKRS